MKKRRFAAAVLFVLAAVGVLLTVSSLIGIFRPINETDPKPGDRTEIEPELGTWIITCDDPIMGDEYFYAVFSLYGSPKGWLVKADKDYGKLFDPDSGRAQTLIFSRGTVKKFDYGMKSVDREVDRFISNNIGECDFEYGTYVDLTARKRYIITLIAGTVCAAASIVPLIFLLRRFAVSKRTEEKKEEKKCEEKKSSSYVIY